MSPSNDQSTRILPSQDLLNCNLPSETLRSFAVGSVFGAFSGYSLGWWSNTLPKTRWAQTASMAGRTGALYAVAYGVAGLTARARDSDDATSYGAGGAAAGVLLGLLQKSFARSLLHAGGLGTLLFSAAYIHQQNKEAYHSGKSIEQRHEELYQDFHKNERKDPFAKRWEQIQARKAD